MGKKGKNKICSISMNCVGAFKNDSKIEIIFVFGKGWLVLIICTWKFRGKFIYVQLANIDYYFVKVRPLK